jgi:cytochrome P450
VRGGLPLLGRLPEFRRDPLGFLQTAAAEQGDVAKFRLGPQNVVLLSHPDDIRDLLVTQNTRFVKNRMLHRARILLGEGLLTSEEPRHTRQRKLVQPAFYRERLPAYAAAMVAHAEQAASRWQQGEAVQLGQEMMRVTLGIVAETLFSAAVEDNATRVGAALTEILEMFDLLMLPLSEYVVRLPLLPVARRFRRARRQLDEIVYGIIAQRRMSDLDPGDLLAMLLSARDEDGVPMSDAEVRDEALTLFLAGHETTATALSWTWYLLSQHPEVEARFHAEIDAVLASRQPVFDDYPRLPYTEMVFAESMRLYPPAWAIGRRAISPHTVRGERFPVDTIFVASPYVTHRSSAYWPEPEKFDPERFRPEAREARHRFAYFPFGGGPRVCIGERFAWLEGVLVLAAVARHWRFRVDAANRPEPLPLITLRPKDGLPATPVRR